MSVGYVHSFVWWPAVKAYVHSKLCTLTLNRNDTRNYEMLTVAVWVLIKHDSISTH
jgi:hypothetical protein